MRDWRVEIRARIASARLHPQDEAELVEEVAQHLEAQYADLVPRVGEARAREQLLAQLRDQEFDDAIARRRRLAKPTVARTWTPQSLSRDVRYGVRSLRRSPGTVIAGVIALALGIGLTTVMYSIMYGLLIKGLPFEKADRIAIVQHGDAARDEDDRGYFGSFVRYQQQQRSFEAFGAYTMATANMSGGDRAERLSISRMTAGALEVTGVRPMLGRTFSASDNAPTAPVTVILSHAIWRDRYRSDSSVVGKEIRINGRPASIIGVMPERFTFPNDNGAWLPLQTDATTLQPWEGPTVTVIGRLRDDATYESANIEFATIAKQLSVDRPSGTPDWRAMVTPFLRAIMPARIYTIFNAMLAAVLLVLLVACANVANLLLDRTAGRTREIGIRTALGASRLAIVRQSLVESGIIALLAAVLGTLIARVGIVVFNDTLANIDHPFWMDIKLHPPVLVFVLAIALLASLVSGILPAMQSVRLDVSAILKDESQAASSLRVGRLSKMIVAVEIAVSAMLLVGTGFLTKSIVNLRTIELGFTSANVFTGAVNVSTRDTVRQLQFFDRLERELTAMPGITAAYVGSGLPGSGMQGDRVAIEGRQYARRSDHHSVRTIAVSPGFFATFQVKLLRGRGIQDTDRLGALPVAVVNEEFARRYFSGVDPIGRRIRLDGRPESKQEWLTIVGVMPKLYASNFGTTDRWPPQVLTAFRQQQAPIYANIAVNGPSDVASAAALRRVVTAVDPDVPLHTTLSMDAVMEETTWGLEVFGGMFIIFGIVALVLAAIGLYAVMECSVSRRVREMGIRMALGATSGDVIRMVCRQGAKQIAIGMTLGLLAGAAIVRAASAALFEVQPSDPGVFVLVSVVLVGAALVACIVPALRATRVDPLVALRTD